MELAGRIETSCSPTSPTSAPHRACEVPLASLEGATGLFSGEVIDYKLECTATEKRACQIVYQLCTWNELLAAAEVEVRETPGTHVGLTVASIWTTHVTDHGPEVLHRAFTLLYFLVKNHHCVRAVDLTIQRLQPYHALLCEALLGNDHIESVRLGDFTPDSLGYCKFFPILQSLKNLKSFECPCLDLPEPCVYALTSLLRTTKVLESLHIRSGWKTGVDPTELLIQLTSYPSLKHLSLHLDILDRVPAECCQEFARYLKNTSTMVALSFPWACNLDADARKAILTGLCANKSILKLDMEVTGFVDEEAVEIIANLFAQNNHLRSFHISPLTSCFFFQPGRYCDSWLGTLAGNDTLEELTLPSNIWRPQQWRRFFGMLLAKRSLKKVTIGWNGFERSDFRSLCQALRETGVEDKVTFAHYICPSCFSDNFTALRCKSFTGIYASTNDDEDTIEVPQLQRLMCELTPLSHVRDVSLFIHPHKNNKDLSCAIAGYIGATTALKKLVLRFCAGAHIEEGTNMCWGVIIESLSRNRSIAELGISTKHMATEEMEYLCQVIRCSENIRQVSYEGEKPPDAFLERLSQDIAGNYSLVRVTCYAHLDRHAFAVRDTVRRNSSLVARASHYRQGAELERLTAAALERVYMHHALLDEFAEVECISVEEAASTLKAALSASNDVHGFMRLAGVVRASVECHPRKDGRAQLDDLNGLCWAAVRRYLLIEDVVPQLCHACPAH